MYGSSSLFSYNCYINVSKEIYVCAISSSVCVYFGFEGLPPVESPILILNGESKLSFARTEGGPPAATINNICFPSQVRSDAFVSSHHTYMMYVNVITRCLGSMPRRASLWPR